jgi:hypothetical protein
MSISATSRYATFNALVGPADKPAAGPRKDSTQDAVAGAGSPPTPSAMVTLSQQAQGFADLASRGITSFTITDGKRVQQELLNRTSGSASGLPQGLGGSISAADFDRIMGQYGATQAQTDQLRQGFDSNGDGAISNDEMLSRLAATSGARGDSPDAQLLMGLMDRSGNADGIVQQGEFTDVETSLVYAEKRKV